MTDVERFITAIRNTIETALMDETNPAVDTFTTVRREAEHTYFIEGEIDTRLLAETIHQTVINHLSPPF